METRGQGWSVGKGGGGGGWRKDLDEFQSNAQD